MAIILDSLIRYLSNLRFYISISFGIANLILIFYSVSIRAVASELPSVIANLTGKAEQVFDTQSQSCEQIDIPDAPARAFRDHLGKVHLIASHYVTRANIGTRLDDVKHDCSIVYRSPEDSEVSHFQDRNWLSSFYTSDGRAIAALVHSEFEAFKFPGMCSTPDQKNNCWWNTITFAQSSDGGYSFSVPKPPNNLVASVPYPYVKGNLTSAYGYNAPTNILKVDDYYYAMINDWPHLAQKYGPCLIRTNNVFDPGSWRAWDGSSFSTRFIDPYREHNIEPERHICQPVMKDIASSFVVHQPSGVFVATQFTPDTRLGDLPGLYLTVSEDMIHWSKPALVVSTVDLRASEVGDNWDYGYFSLLDPASRDRNFSTISDTPYVYFVRLDKKRPPYTRTLFRRRIALHINQ